MTRARDLAKGTFSGDLTVDTNTLVVDSANNRVGVGTSSPSARLHLKAGDNSYAGGIQIEDADSASKSAVTHVNGNLYISSNATQDHLAIDSIGAVTMPYQPAFQVNPASEQSNIAVGSNVTVVLGTEVFDVGANFASNTFTAPVTGKYQLNLVLYFNYLDTASDYYVTNIVTSNRNYPFAIDPRAFGSDPVYWFVNSCVLADMDASDTATVVVVQASGTAQTDIATGTTFSGYLVA